MSLDHQQINHCNFLHLERTGVKFYRKPVNECSTLLRTQWCVWLCGARSWQWFILMSASHRGLRFMDTYSTTSDYNANVQRLNTNT